MSSLPIKKCIIVYYQFNKYYVSLPITLSPKYFETDIIEIIEQLLQEEDIEYTIGNLYTQFLVKERMSQYNVFEISYENLNKLLSLSLKNTYIILCSFDKELTYELQGELEVLDHLPQIHIIKDNKLFRSYSKYKCFVSWMLSAEYDVIAEDEEDADNQCRTFDLSDFNAEYVDESFEVDIQ